MIFWICLALFLIYFVGYEFWWGLTRYPQIIFAIGQGHMPKTRFYTRLMLGLWIPAGLVSLLVANGRLSWKDLGINWFEPGGPPWLFYVLAAIAGVYFIYLVYSLIVLRIYAMKKQSINQNIPDEVKVLLPVTKKEKQIWVFTAVTAGITEELLYRGFLFFLMGALFPGLNIFIILVVSALIFGTGHVYQGFFEAAKAMLIGLIFGLFFIAFGTIIPCIVLHTMQDMCAADMINEP